MAIELPSNIAKNLVAALERKYIWWPPVGNASHSVDRVIAQAMNLGAFEDIRRLEPTLAAACLGILAWPPVTGVGQSSARGAASEIGPCRNALTLGSF